MSGQTDGPNPQDSVQSIQAPPPEFRLTKLFWIGLVTLVVGTGPLLLVALLATLGATKDPRPNPVGLGFIAFLTFWPSVGIMLWQVRGSFYRYRAARKRFQQQIKK